MKVYVIYALIVKKVLNMSLLVFSKT